MHLKTYRSIMLRFLLMCGLLSCMMGDVRAQSEYYVGKLKAKKEVRIIPCNPNQQQDPCQIRDKSKWLYLNDIPLGKLEAAQEALKTRVGEKVIIEKNGDQVTVRKVCSNKQFRQHKGRIDENTFNQIC